MAHSGRAKWNRLGGVPANARRELPLLVTAYFTQVRDFLAKDPAPPKLHRLRLASKRLRYTLELFRPCYPAAFEERIGALKKLQDHLGEVNDAVASVRLLKEELKRYPKVRQFLKDRASEQAEHFIRHWKETFDAPGQEAWWTDFLAHSARPTRNISKS